MTLEFSSTAVLDDEASRRKRRQGSDTRQMGATLKVRCHQDWLDTLSERSDGQLPTLIRQYGDLLTELLPVAKRQGVDPVELIRETATTLLNDRELHKQAS
ncbi:hypothetical protein A5761_11035 [Mycolicibacterium setense]|uniref:hypothetical protein n=1 Tax=Mycolicibacterium setense TaxID=431269 RepID=UPI0007EAA551|nr:hypothetical protein [Mycolicibacterium setense]OBB16988.1 hypothetical protein A5761_11035 [Mycolicibacterium setense]